MKLTASMTALVAGLIFSIGLGIGGMTQPDKVIGFLDVAGSWDPSLMGVMGGGMLVAFFAFRWAARRGTPIFAEKFEIPKRTDITPQLVVGSALFGAGWGIGGYCPGPGLASLVSGSTHAFVFVGTMLAGMLLFRATPASWKGGACAATTVGDIKADA